MGALPRAAVLLKLPANRQAGPPVAPLIAVQSVQRPLPARNERQPLALNLDQNAANGPALDPAVGIEDIYNALQHGAGREHVTDGNVAALIVLAKQRGDVQREYLLREWRSPCGDDPAAPPMSEVQGNPPPR